MVDWVDQHRLVGALPALRTVGGGGAEQTVVTGTGRSVRPLGLCDGRGHAVLETLQLRRGHLVELHTAGARLHDSADNALCLTDHVGEFRVFDRANCIEQHLRFSRIDAYPPELVVHIDHSLVVLGDTEEVDGAAALTLDPLDERLDQELVDLQLIQERVCEIECLPSEVEVIVHERARSVTFFIDVAEKCVGGFAVEAALLLHIMVHGAFQRSRACRPAGDIFGAPNPSGALQCALCGRAAKL